MEFINGTTGIQPPTNCSILSSTPSATFSSTPSVSLPASTAATLSSTSCSPPSHLQIVPLLLLPLLLFPPQLTLLCHLLLVLLPSSRLQIVPLFLLLPLLLFLFQLPLFCHLLLVLRLIIFFLFFLFFSLSFLLSLGKKTLWTTFQYRQISIKSPLSHYVVARYYSCCSERKQQGNKHCRRGNYGNKQCLRENYREISFLIHGCYCGNYDIKIYNHGSARNMMN